jgi:hypothetical protein
MHRSTRLAFCLLALSAPALFAADNATVTASARIYKPITLALTNGGLSFGDIFTDPTGGTVTLDPAGVRSTSGPVLATTGSAYAAAFAVTGKRNATYAITLPASASLAGPGAPMTVNGFQTSAAGTLDGSGNQAFTLGATLAIGANQTDGDYSGTFSVSVAYN